jgi:hypothetical protein
MAEKYIIPKSDQYTIGDRAYFQITLRRDGVNVIARDIRVNDLKSYYAEGLRDILKYALMSPLSKTAISKIKKAELVQILEERLEYAKE